MGDFAVDTTHMAATLGCQWLSLSVDDYIRGAENASTDDVAGLTSEYRRCYELTDDLTDSDLDVTARAELSLRRLVAENRLDALSYQFMAFGEDRRTATVPFVAVSRLMADGVGFGGEGDLIAGRGHLAVGATSVAGHVQRNLHNRLRGQQPLDEPHGRSERSDGSHRPKDPPGRPTANRSFPPLDDNWPWSRTSNLARRPCSPLPWARTNDGK